MQGINRGQPETEQSKALLRKYDQGNWQLGHTKVFMREALENTLEKDRHRRLKSTVQKIQAFIMGCIQRKRYLKQRAAAIRMQAVLRMYLVRSAHLKRVAAATKIQVRICDGCGPGQLLGSKPNAGCGVLRDARRSPLGVAVKPVCSAPNWQKRGASSKNAAAKKNAAARSGEATPGITTRAPLTGPDLSCRRSVRQNCVAWKRKPRLLPNAKRPSGRRPSSGWRQRAVERRKKRAAKWKRRLAARKKTRRRWPMPSPGPGSWNRNRSAKRRRRGAKQKKHSDFWKKQIASARYIGWPSPPQNLAGGFCFYVSGARS
jgi:hypothetical protein